MSFATHTLADPKDNLLKKCVPQQKREKTHSERTSTSIRDSTLRAKHVNSTCMMTRTLSLFVLQPAESELTPFCGTAVKKLKEASQKWEEDVPR